MLFAFLPFMFFLYTETLGLMLPARQASDNTDPENVIIVPSWIGHLPQATLLVQSFHENCEDKRSITVYIIVSEDEVAHFKDVPSHSPDTVVKIVTLQSLLPKTIDGRKLLEQLGKVSFQGLKKMMGLAYLPFQRALLLDSESFFVRRINLGSFMKSAARELIYVPHALDDGMNGFQRNALEVANRVLNTSIDSWAGMALRYQWIFEKSIHSDMLAGLGLGQPENMVRFFQAQDNVFPEIIYYTYLFSRKDQLNMRLFDAREALRDGYTQMGFPVKKCRPWCAHRLEHLGEDLSGRDVRVVMHMMENGMLGHSFTWTKQSPGNEKLNKQLICEESSIRVITSTDTQLFGNATHLKDLCPTNCVGCE